MADDVIGLVVKAPVDKAAANKDHAVIGNAAGVTIGAELSGIGQALDTVQNCAVIGAVEADSVCRR